MCENAGLLQSALRSHLPSSPNISTMESYWPQIASKDDIPVWLQDNNFIVNSHPMPTGSYKRSFRLWRCLHMETMNIWTHLMGTIALIATGVALSTVAVSAHRHVTVGDKFVFGISTTTAALCFALSTTFHTLRSHSYRVHHLWGRLDLLGICLLAVGAGSSANYYALRCDKTAQHVYWCLNGSAAVAVAIMLFDTGGGGSRMRMLRGSVFSVLALTTMLPILHGIGQLGWRRASVEIGAQWYLAEGMVLLFGVSCFVGRLPERISPGSFDIWGHSHQVHHMCALVAQAFHVIALVVGYEYRNMHPTC
jgi:adiponectin receptor